MNDRPADKASATEAATPATAQDRRKSWRELTSTFNLVGLFAATIGHVAVAVSSIADKARPPLFWLSAASLVAILTTWKLLASSQVLRRHHRWLLATCIATALG